jgi:hypothetical protein
MNMTKYVSGSENTTSYELRLNHMVNEITCI